MRTTRWMSIGTSVAMLLLAVAVAVPVLAAPEQYALWHMEARPERMNAISDLIGEFNQANPDVNIRVEVQSWGDVFVKAVAAVQAGRQPDFMFTSPDFTMNLMMTGTVRTVDDEFSLLSSRYNIYQQAVDPFYFDEHYWALPLYGMSEVLWYRKDLFEKAGINPNEPPHTWSELLSTAERLVESGVVRYPIAVPGDWHLATTQQIWPLMVVNGAEHIFAEDGSIAFDNPRTVEAYEFYKKLFDMSPPGSEAWQWDQPIAAFVGGQVAMVIEKGQYNEQWDLRTDLPGELLGAAPIPVPDKGGQPGTSYYSNGIMLLRPSEDSRRVFVRLVEFLYEPRNMAKSLLAAPGFFLPVTEEAAVEPTLLEHPTVARHRDTYQLMIEQSQYGKLYGFTRRPYSPYIGRITAQEILSWTAQRMIYDGLSAEEAVSLGAERMREAVQ